ncbi:hypothetical protein D039_4381A, partial [Vibrio parahaemolyticus EKP-028]
MRLLWS